MRTPSTDTISSSTRRPGTGDLFLWRTMAYLARRRPGCRRRRDLRARRHEPVCQQFHRKQCLEPMVIGEWNAARSVLQRRQLRRQSRQHLRNAADPPSCTTATGPSSSATASAAPRAMPASTSCTIDTRTGAPDLLLSQHQYRGQATASPTSRRPIWMAITSPTTCMPAISRQCVAVRSDQQ